MITIINYINSNNIFNNVILIFKFINKINDNNDYLI